MNSPPGILTNHLAEEFTLFGLSEGHFFSLPFFLLLTFSRDPLGHVLTVADLHVPL